MSSPELETWKVGVRRAEQAQEQKLKIVLHSDRAAVDIGIMVVRTLVFLTAGSVVLLFGFVGQLWTKDSKIAHSVLNAMDYFIWAVVLAGLCSFATYFVSIRGDVQKLGTTVRNICGTRESRKIRMG